MPENDTWIFYVVIVPGNNASYFYQVSMPVNSAYIYIISGNNNT